MLENVLKQCKSNALRPLVMVWGPNGRGGHPQKMHEKVVAKALAVKQKGKEKILTQPTFAFKKKKKNSDPNTLALWSLSGMLRITVPFSLTASLGQNTFLLCLSTAPVFAILKEV